MAKNKARKQRGRRTGDIKPFPASQPECYLSKGFNAQPIGPAYNDATYTSLGFNDYMMNTAAGHISLGTGTNLRLGKHILFTYLRIRGLLTCGNATSSAPLGSIRIIVGANPKDTTCANLTSAAAVAQYVESTEILEAPLSTYLGGSIRPWHTMVSPSTDYTILYDRVHMTDHNSIVISPYASPYLAQQEYIDLIVPLGLERTYNQSGAVDQGSFFFYMVCSQPSASNTCYFSGEARVDFINCWSFEDLGQKSLNFLRQAYKLWQMAKKNPVVNAAIEWVPTVLAGAGM